MHSLQFMAQMAHTHVKDEVCRDLQWNVDIIITAAEDLLWPWLLHNICSQSTNTLHLEHTLGPHEAARVQPRTNQLSRPMRRPDRSQLTNERAGILRSHARPQPGFSLGLAWPWMSPSRTNLSAHFKGCNLWLKCHILRIYPSKMCRVLLYNAAVWGIWWPFFWIKSTRFRVWKEEVEWPLTKSVIQNPCRKPLIVPKKFEDLNKFLLKKTSTNLFWQSYSRF